MASTASSSSHIPLSSPMNLSAWETGGGCPQREACRCTNPSWGVSAKQIISTPVPPRPLPYHTYLAVGLPSPLKQPCSTWAPLPQTQGFLNFLFRLGNRLAPDGENNLHHTLPDRNVKCCFSTQDSPIILQFNQTQASFSDFKKPREGM